ncbi:MAG: DUF72 domain-containing protein [candidate division Zixibacteria bacterium]|nr:DUF72 domain-containing protein [candidate division Zixibacteria bacterium]
MPDKIQTNNTSDSQPKADRPIGSVQIGTSGYSFEDWRGSFYPDKIDKGKMLDYYVQHFPTVEINSTYYGIPHPRVMANLIKKAPDGFDSLAKLHQSFTHRRSDLETDRKSFSEAILPLVEAGKLSGLLAQFPYSFKYSADNLDYTSICREAFPNVPLFVEFRHNSWVNRTMYERLKGEGVGYVCVDEPQLDGLLKPDVFATTETGYIRLHGRNAESWWTGGSLRYDYLYSNDELQEWNAKVKRLTAKVNKVYVLFNNCHQGKAVSNARQFVEMTKYL